MNTASFKLKRPLIQYPASYTSKIKTGANNNILETQWYVLYKVVVQTLSWVTHTV